jgi:ABC-2 type transport system ATP-binding protein
MMHRFNHGGSLMNPIIICENLTKNYGSQNVLKGIDLEVPPATVYALLGTNGAGKTTLIRTLLGLIPSSGGVVKVLGEEPYQIGPSLRQRIGYVSEEQGLYGWMTVKEIITFCKSLYTQWNDSMVADYIHRFKLELHARIRTLSKGQTTKLALILALAPQPDLLILDEPMSGLDPLAQHEFLQLVRRDIQSEGRSVFFSTHILADVEAIAEQVAILFDGKIQVAGSIAAVCNLVNKLTVSGEIPQSFPGFVVLAEEPGAQTVLVAAADYQKFAAGQTISSPVMPVSLHEAFLYFCSGRNER